MTLPNPMAPEEANALLAKLELLDLDPIKFKLISPDGDGWDRERADLVAEVYKRFLFLAVTEPNLIVPTQDVDTFWHRHILDTRKYMDDCNELFGFYLHHFPYFGMRGQEDQKSLQDAFEATCQIYERVFGSSYTIGVGANCGGCGTDCGGQNCGRDIHDTRFKMLRPDLRPTLAA